MKKFALYGLYGGLYAYFISPLHTRSAGSGVQVPTADIPSGNLQVALILPGGTYPGLHLKTNSTVLMFSIIPFSGACMGHPTVDWKKNVASFLHIPPRALNHYDVEFATYPTVHITSK